MVVLSKNVKNKFWREVVTAWRENKTVIEQTVIAKYKLNSVSYLDFYNLRKSGTSKWSCCFETNLDVLDKLI